MSVAGFDHAAIPIQRVAEMLAFYRRLGFGVDERNAPRYSVHFGRNRINLHGPAAWQDPAFTLRGPAAVPGCGDFCFVWDDSEDALVRTLRSADAQVVAGPVARAGARGQGMSTYVRDPDANLLEFIIYPDA